LSGMCPHVGEHITVCLHRGVRAHGKGRCGPS
jgi:hypothetical protein